MKNEEEVRKIVCEEIENKKYSRKIDIFIFFGVSLLVIYSVLTICEAFKYNAEHKSYDKELDFCRSVYESDNVVLQQCEKFFVILNNVERK